MLGLGAHADFLKNNRGINDGADLPEDYMCDLYDRIQTNEIKMKVVAAASYLPSFLSFASWQQDVTLSNGRVCMQQMQRVRLSLASYGSNHCLS